MSKPMTISEAVGFIRGLLPLWALMPAPEGLDPTMYGTGTRDGDNDVNKRLREALATLEGKRLCDESEARGVLMDLIRQHAKIASDPNYLGVFQLAQVHGMPYTGPQFDLSAARRWLAEHGGE